jgi:hypothetical protein
MKPRSRTDGRRTPRIREGRVPSRRLRRVPSAHTEFTIAESFIKRVVPRARTASASVKSLCRSVSCHEVLVDHDADDVGQRYQPHGRVVLDDPHAVELLARQLFDDIGERGSGSDGDGLCRAAWSASNKKQQRVSS